VYAGRRHRRASSEVRCLRQGSRIWKKIEWCAEKIRGLSDS
jgi:hypothetical protein